MDLIRKALLAIEELQHTANVPLSLEGFDPQEVQYHVGLLYDDQYIKALKVGSMDGTTYFPTGLTASGHELVDSIRDNGVWQNIKQLSVKQTGSLTFEGIRRAIRSRGAAEDSALLAEKVTSPQRVLTAESRNPRAFVSYGSEDRVVVKNFAGDLRGYGVDAWGSIVEIKPGGSV